MSQDIGLKTEACFVWTTKIPDNTNDVQVSPSFTLQNSRYSFRLEIHGDLGYYLYLQNGDGWTVYPRPWDTTAGIAEGNDACLIERRRAHDKKYHTIWYNSVSNISRAVSLFDWSRFLSFRVLFHVDAGLSNLRLKTEDKSVQTSSHLDNHSDFEALALDFAKLLDGGPHHDVDIKCGERSFKAHRNILSARSKWFSAMLQSDMVEGNTGQVDIKDMEAEIFGYFLEYLYTSKLPELSVDVAKQLYEAGDKCAVEELKNNCARFLRHSLKRVNCCDILVLADQHSDQHLKEAVITYMMGEKLPLCDDIWPKFCDIHPKLANVVVNRFCKLHCSK